MEKKRSHLRLSGKKERGLLPSVFFGFVFTAIFSLVFLLAASLFSYNAEDPSALLMPLAYISLAISSLVFGFSSAKMAGRNGLFCGILSGGLLSFFLFVSGMIFSDGYSVLHALPVFLCVLMIAALGGFLGGRKSNKRRRIGRTA